MAINPKYISAAEVGKVILSKQDEKRDTKFYKKYRKGGLVALHKEIYPLVKPVQEMALWPEFSLRKIKLFPGETLTDLVLANAIVLAHEYDKQEKGNLSLSQLSDKAIEYYNELASKLISLASPFFNNLRKDGKANLSSCFIYEVGDSLKSIMKHVTYAAEISKAGGGCVPAHTEYLTPTGWRRFDEYSPGDLVGQYRHETKTVEFVEPENYIKLPCDEFYHLKTTHGINQELSEEHKVLYYSTSTSTNLLSITAKELASNYIKNAKGFRGKIPVSANAVDTAGLNYTDDQLRLIVAVQADGSVPRQGSRCFMTFSKERKIARLEELLTRLGRSYTKVLNNRSETTVAFNYPELIKVFPKEFYSLSSTQLQVITNEVTYWDGTLAIFPSYCSTIKSNADFIQYAFSMCGYRGSLLTTKRSNPKHSDSYFVKGLKSNKVALAKGQDSAGSVTKTPSLDGFKYCFTVETGALILRNNNSVFITGNSGVYMGRVRSKGATIAGNKNASSGVMPWTRLFDQVCVSVNQLGQRPGAITVALPIWHADIEEFLDCQTENGDLRAKAYNIQPQVCIPDYFMKELEAGSDTFLFCPYQLEANNIDPSKNKDWYQEAVAKKLYRGSISARKLWAIIQEREMTVGRPYIFYTDNAQINSPFKKSYGNINSANLCCLSPETLILTELGEKPIASIAGTLSEPNMHRVWNGINYANSPVYKVADEQVLYRVKFSQGQYVDVTEDHNFFVATQDSLRDGDTDRYDKLLKVQTRDLGKGMRLPLVYMPGTGSTSAYLQKAKNYVTSVKKLEGLHTVYCLTEPLRNMVIANGVPTGQCESYSYFEAERYIHCCNLASINLAEHTSFESISKSTAIATEMADLSLNISSIDIKEAQDHVRDFRTIGVGMMGLADWLAANGEYYSSLEFIEKTQKTISIAAYKKSVELASKWGACLAYDQLESDLWDLLDSELEGTKEMRSVSGVRNSMLLATAPNTSTSLVMGATASFLPPYSHEFYDESEDHTLPVVCKYDPNNYLTNQQIPQEFITDATAVMQKYMDAGISMEYLYPKGSSWSTNKRVSDNKINAWKKGVKAVYYLRTIDTKTSEGSRNDGGCSSGACQN